MNANAASLRIALLSVAVVGVVCVASIYSICVKETFLGVMVGGASFSLLVVLLPVVLFAGYLRWRKRSGLWILPAIVCVASLGAAWMVRSLATTVADTTFKSHLSQYEAALREIKNDAPNLSERWKTVDLKKTRPPPEVLSIMARRCGSNDLIVEFLVSAGGRIHKGYLFRGCVDSLGNELDDKEKRYRLTPVSGPWYRFSSR